MGRVVILLSALVCLTSAAPINAQKKPVTTSSLCTRDIAIDTSKQQILDTRTFDNPVQRIAILLRAADLLWPHEPDKALAAFMEAFDLAVQNFKEHGDQVERTSKSQFAARISVPDQRFKVITALAKRNPARARKLSEQMLEDSVQDAAVKTAAGDALKTPTGEKLLQVAIDLVSTDVMSALSFARLSFRHPASILLPLFCYKLARVNKNAADRIYNEALVAYSRSPMDQFLYLSAYPFGNKREAGEMPSYMMYSVPDDYTPNRALQHAFMQVLLNRAETTLAMAVDTSPAYRYPDHAQMWFALTRLEKQVQDNLPELAERTGRVKDRLFSLLNPTIQQQVTRQIESDNAPKRSFDEQVEAAEKVKDPGRRDQQLTSAVTSSSKDLPLERVLNVIDKISDSGVRDSLLNWFYYFRAQGLIADKDFIEARRSAAKVTELDQRAYLFTRIAEESLKIDDDQTAAREMLDEVAQAVSKAPKTIVSARAVLALAHLYAKFDVNRGIEELGNAVRTINALESPDFSREFVIMKIEGKTFGSFAAVTTPGFNPENAFREMGKLDFDGSLAQATTFSDKSLRALTTLAVIEPCFEVRSPKGSK